MINARLLPFFLLVGGASLAQADVLVNTFGGTGLGYFPSVGWNLDSTQSLGKTFSVASDYNFSEIDVALRMDSETDQMLVSLRSDSSGQPGSALEAFTVSNTFGAGVSGVYNLASLSNPLMTAGTYYVTIEPLNGSTGKWMLNNGGGQGSMVVSSDGGGTWAGFTDTNGAIQVTGVLATPEPVSMIGLGLGVLAVVRKRRKS